MGAGPDQLSRFAQHLVPDARHARRRRVGDLPVALAVHVEVRERHHPHVPNTPASPLGRRPCRDDPEALSIGEAGQRDTR